MSEPAARRATYQDVLDAPEHLVAELVQGELSTHPRPAPPHAFAASALGADLIASFQRGRGGPGGWWVLDEPELHLDDAVLVPDLAAWRVERLPVMPVTPWFEVPPDWICEVLSRSTTVHDRTAKLPVYARAGVAHAWLLDPVVETLEVLRLDDAKGLWVVVATHAGAEHVRAEPFAAVDLDLAQIWPPRPPA